MPTSLTVRALQESDFNAWLPLWNAYNAFYGREGPTALDPAVTHATWARFFDPNEPVFALVGQREEGELLGLAHFLHHRSTSRIELTCYLQDLSRCRKPGARASAGPSLKRCTRRPGAQASSGCTGKHTTPTPRAAVCTTGLPNTMDSSSTRTMCELAASVKKQHLDASQLGRTVMRNFSSLLIAVAGLAVAASASEAAPTNKCIVNGTVTYQQGPCPSNQVRKDPTLDELNAAEKKRRAAAASAAAAAPRESARTPTVVSSDFSCDGRQHCSQMRSCEEAKYFLANCPGVKMDGDGDGIPCEEQWCSR